MRLNIDNPLLSMNIISKQFLGRKRILLKGYGTTHMVKRRLLESESRDIRRKNQKYVSSSCCHWAISFSVICVFPLLYSEFKFSKEMMYLMSPVSQ